MTMTPHASLSRLLLRVTVSVALAALAVPARAQVKDYS
jgi:hypothetical protein